MARRSRQDEPDSWHHVMNRGLARRTVFENRADMRFFLSRLAHAVRRGELEVHAYSVLTTHFHLLVRSPRGALSDAMRRIQNEYVRYFNRKRRRDGALFRGRFTSRHVDSLVYREVLVRYIDYNPVQARLVPDPREYRHGSAHWYARAKGPPWLERSWVEGLIRERARDDAQRAAGRAALFGEELPPGLVELVELRIAGGQRGPDPLDELVCAAPERVVAWMKYKARLADGTRPGVVVCDPESVSLLIELKRAEFGEWVTRPGRKPFDAWLQMQVGLLRDLSGLTWPEVAQRLGNNRSGVARIGERHQRLLLEDDVYAERVAGVAREALRRCGLVGVRSQDKKPQ